VYFRAGENPWHAIADPVGSRQASMVRADERGDEARTRRRRRDEAGGVDVESGGARTTGR